MTNQELILEWQRLDDQARALWKEILHRGLFLVAMGLDPKKRLGGWYNPQAETAASRPFYHKVQGVTRGARPAIQHGSALELGDDDFEGLE